MTLFNLILIVVIAIYMLLDMPRLEAAINRRFPPGTGHPLTRRIERALAGYVRGQLVLSTVIGLSAGIGMWVLGTTGLVPGAERYALLFGVWTAAIEVIPYIGPVAGVGAARDLRARRPSDLGVIWVVVLFVFIYQIEGHIVVPNVMANALRLHPLLVIFGLLAGGELYGIAGRAAGAADDGRAQARSGSSSASGCSSSPLGRRRPPARRRSSPRRVTPRSR